MADEDKTDVCPQHEGLAEDIREIKRTLTTILRVLGDGKVNFATLALRVTVLERIVFCAVGALVLASGGAILWHVWPH